MTGTGSGRRAGARRCDRPRPLLKMEEHALKLERYTDFWRPPTFSVILARPMVQPRLVGRLLIDRNRGQQKALTLGTLLVLLLLQRKTNGLGLLLLPGLCGRYERPLFQINKLLLEKLRLKMFGAAS
jgi:hypothetical protein